MPLSQAKSDMVAGIFAAAPDDALGKLASVLAKARGLDPKLEPVHAIASAEIAARRIVAGVFAPVVPMTLAAAPPRKPTLTNTQLAKAWRAAAKADPDLTGRTAALVQRLRDHDEPPPELDLVCACAAELVAEKDPRLAIALRIAPVLRTVQPRLDGWVRNVSGETVAAIRLAFKDALEADENAGPMFWEAVFAMLDAPWQVLRLISAAIDRPSDRYLAASELAGLGERLLDDIDTRLLAVKRFDPAAGDAAAAVAAHDLVITVQEIAEFEEWLAINKEGPWGKRLVEQRQNLALCMEAKLRDAEAMVAAATPTQAPRGGVQRNVRPVPRLTVDPDPVVVTKAGALLVLMEEARGAAGPGGFASARAKTIESLDKRLEQYCDDLVDALHRGDSEAPERLRAYLEIGARLWELLKGPSAGQNVRRRAAAA